MKLEILFRDPDIIAVNKPTGWLTHPDDPNDPASLDVVSVLRRDYGINYAGIHQRLDREVSGVLVFAARKEANRWLAPVFEGKKAIKEYLALVYGRLPKQEGSIDRPVADSAGKPPRPALTRYKVETVSPDNRRSLVRLRLETGRTHQLRAHMAALGCPIIGDPLFNPGQKTVFPRLMLHAARLVLPGEEGRDTLEIEAPLPPQFEKILAGQLLPEFELLTGRAGLKGLSRGHMAGLVGLLEMAGQRRACFDEKETSLYCLVNGMADGLPGLTVDRYGDALVLSFYDETIQAGSPVVPLVVEALERAWPDPSIYVKFRPETASRLGDGPPPEVSPPLPFSGPPLEQVVAKESGLNYLIKPGDGLSVGLFPDMRQLRTRVKTWAKGKSVLNCFSYTCGFGVVATAGEAARVLNLDVSGKVLEWGKENYRANGFTPDEQDFVEGDVFEWLERLARKNQTFDIMLLDPPSYSTTRQTRFAADRDYRKLAELGARVVAPGGLIIACTNHAGLDRRDFRQAVLRGLELAGRKINGNLNDQPVYEEPFLDFPHNENGYLKILVFRLT